MSDLNPVVEGSLSGILLPERLVREMLQNAFDERELKARQAHFRREDPVGYQAWANSTGHRARFADGLPHYDSRYLSTGDTVCDYCDDMRHEDGCGLLAEDIALDYRARLEYPDEGNPYLVLTVGLDCSRCGSGYEVSITLGFDVEEIVGDIGPNGGGAESDGP